MKKFVVIAVLLQLCLSVLEVTSEPQFGDLIEFPQKIMVNKPVYSHYGIYVDGEKLEGKTDENIFEMTSMTIMYFKSITNILKTVIPTIHLFKLLSMHHCLTGDPPGCRFSKKTGPFTIRNDYYDEKPKTVAGMKAPLKLYASQLWQV